MKGLPSMAFQACAFGACALAPVVVIDGKVYGGMSPVKMERMIDKLSSGNSISKPEQKVIPMKTENRVREIR